MENQDGSNKSISTSNNEGPLSAYEIDKRIKAVTEAITKFTDVVVLGSMKGVKYVGNAIDDGSEKNKKDVNEFNEIMDKAISKREGKMMSKYGEIPDTKEEISRMYSKFTSEGKAYIGSFVSSAVHVFTNGAKTAAEKIKEQFKKLDGWLEEMEDSDNPYLRDAKKDVVKKDAKKDSNDEGSVKKATGMDTYDDAVNRKNEYHKPNESESISKVSEEIKDELIRKNVENLEVGQYDDDIISYGEDANEEDCDPCEVLKDILDTLKHIEKSNGELGKKKKDNGGSDSDDDKKTKKKNDGFFSRLGGFLRPFFTGFMDVLSFIGKTVKNITGLIGRVGGWLVGMLKAAFEQFMKDEQKGADYVRTVGYGGDKAAVDRVIRNSYAKTGGKGIADTVESGLKNTMSDVLKGNLHFSNLKNRILGIYDSVKDSVVAKFGLDHDTYVDETQKLHGTLGRQTAIGNSGTTYAIGGFRRMGLDVSEAAKNFDVIGKDLISANKLLGDIYNRSSKHGLAFSKVSNEFQKNLKIAQSYTFSSGLKGMADMAEKAASIKMNMSMVTAMMEKASTLEGSISMGANLSVMGGNFAAYSNPLELLNASLNSAEDMEKIIENMTKDIVTWNSEKGMLDMSSYDRQRIKYVAKDLGMSQSELTDMMYAKARRDRVETQLDTTMFGNSEKDKSVQEYILNNAQLNDNGEAYVDIYDKTTKENISVPLEDFNANFEGYRDSIYEQQKSDAEKLSDVAVNTQTINEKIVGFQDALKEALFYEAYKLISDLLTGKDNSVLISKAKEKWKVVEGWTEKLLGGVNSVIRGVRSIADWVVREWGSDEDQNEMITELTKKWIEKTYNANRDTKDYSGKLLLSDENVTKVAEILSGAFQWTGKDDLIERLQKGEADEYLKYAFTRVHGNGLSGSEQKVNMHYSNQLIGYNYNANDENNGLFVNDYLNEYGGFDRAKKISEQHEKDFRENGRIQTYSPTNMGSQFGIIMGKGNVPKFEDGSLPVFNGPSHIDGGIPANVYGKPAEVEGGEAIISKKYTKQFNEPLLAINNGTFDYEYMNRGDQLRSLSVRDRNEGQFRGYGNFGPNRITIDPIDVNGTIRLELNGYSKAFDPNDLHLNDVIINEIADRIFRRGNVFGNSGFNMEETGANQRKWQMGGRF